MSLLYKDPKHVIYEVEIKPRKDSDKIEMFFYSDCGKFGTIESLDEYSLTPLELLEILQTHEKEI